MTDVGKLTHPDVEDPPQPEQRSTAHYVLVTVAVMLMMEATVFSAVMFTNILHNMIPPFTPGQLPWIVTITFLVGSALQPLAGKLSDVFGYKRLFLAAAVLFLAGSLLGALTSSFPMMMVARVLQASVIAMPGVNYAFFREYLPKRMVPIVIGLSATGIGVAVAIGPIISGALVGSFSYHSVFWFCFLYMLALAPVLYFGVPDIGRRSKRRIDVGGAFLLTVGIGMLLFGFTQSSSKGWTSAGTLVPFAIAVLSFVGFVILENGLPEPLIDMKLLASPALRTSLLIALFASVPASSSGFLIPQMLESHAGGGVSYGMGMSSFHAGLFGLFTGVVTMICGPLGGYLCRRYSPRLVVLTCSVIGVVASVVIALAHDHLWQYAISMMLFGVASGFYYAGTVNLVIEAVPPRLTGVSGGLQATTSALTSGAAPVLATVVLALYVVGGAGSAYAGKGYTYVFLGAAVFGVIAVVLSLFMRHGRAQATGGAAVTD
ncbi:MFS transporter [Streptomyces prunicolor]|uniref:MFS transporter n=1 Tax=Streptomyces prunicolor TaxID=67348 RepID=A0ABU4FBU2_9ACTN|nr:MFS transporter [Streptomyces prunicolor]MCX5240381.1 MFS transporter [Streptomyces prunicolor]MDV7218064.1 MFS transporter [Streptomyces prunicolor]